MFIAGMKESSWQWGLPLVLALMHSLWQCLLIAALAWLSLRFVPARLPGVRYWVGIVALAAMVLGVAGTFAFAVKDGWRTELAKQQAVAEQEQARRAEVTATGTALEEEQKELDRIEGEQELAGGPAAASTPKAEWQATLANQLVKQRAKVSELKRTHENAKADLMVTALPGAKSAVTVARGWVEVVRIPGWAVPWIGWLWGAGVAFMTARMLRGVIGAAILKRRASPITFGAEYEMFKALAGESRLLARARLALSEHVKVPCVVGWLWPVIMLPARGLSMVSPEELRLILAHELAHVRRFDGLVNLFQSMAESLLFFNPAVWWINRVIRQEREACCDAEAMSRGAGTVESYAEALLHWGALVGNDSHEPRMAITGGRGREHKLMDRVKRLIMPNAVPELATPMWTVMLVTVVAVVLLVGVNPNEAKSTGQALLDIAARKSPEEEKANRSAFIKRITSLYQEEKYDEALLMINQGLDSRSDDADLVMLKKMTEKAMGASAEVKDARVRALLANADRQIAHEYYESGLKKVEAALQLKPDHADALYLKAWLDEIMRARAAGARPTYPYLGRDAMAKLNKKRAQEEPKSTRALLTEEEAAQTRLTLAKLLEKYPHWDVQEEDKLNVKVRLTMKAGDGTTGGTPMEVPPETKLLVRSQQYRFQNKQDAWGSYAQGVWTLRVPRGHYAVAAYVPGYGIGISDVYWAQPGQGLQEIEVTMRKLEKRQITFASDKGSVKPDSIVVRVKPMPSKRSAEFSRTFDWPVQLMPIEGPGPWYVEMPTSGTAYIRTNAHGYSAKPSIHVLDGEPIAVRLEPAASVSGKVVDSVTGEPIANATVIKASTSDRDPFEVTAVSDAQGAFVMDTLDPAVFTNDRTKVNLSVGAPGYGIEQVRDVKQGALDKEVKLTRTVMTEVELTGDLTRLGGYPDAPYVVAKTLFYSGEKPGQGTVESKEVRVPVKIQDGRGIANVETHGTLGTILSLEQYNWLGLTLGVRERKKPGTPVTINLGPEKGEREVTLDFTGVPVEAIKGATAWVQYKVPRDIISQETKEQRLTIGDDGKAKVKLPVHWWFQVRVDGWPNDWGWGSLGGETTPLDVEKKLEPAQTGSGIFGRLVDQDGGTMAGCRVELEPLVRVGGVMTPGNIATVSPEGFSLPWVMRDVTYRVLVHRPELRRGQVQTAMYAGLISVTQAKPMREIVVTVYKDGTASLRDQ
jgi:beta-lactamase regulating signal transducer with metallopeptidase domain